MSYFEKAKCTIHFIILIMAILLGIWVIYQGFDKLTNEFMENRKDHDDIISILNKSTSSISSAKEDF